MKNVYKLALAFIAVATFSCSSDDDSNPSGGNCDSDIEWFQPGKFQKYNLSQFGFPAGQMKLSFGNCSNGDGLLTTRQMYDGAGALVSETEDIAWQEGSFLMMDVNADGDDVSKLYKKDAQLGDTWEQTLLDGRIITREVVDMDSIVTVPAGTFNCKVYKYTTSTAANESFIFWNDEFGQIMEDAGFFMIQMTEHN